MSTQQYVLAKCDQRQDLVHGDFSDSGGVGHKFKRDKFTGGEIWEITKIFTHEQQQQLAAIETLIGPADLRNLFLVR